MKRIVTQTVQFNAQSATQKLERKGTVQQAHSGLVYLAIDNNYIHTIFQLIDDKNVAKVDYFSGPHAIGAHISIIYPEELPTLMDRAICPLVHTFEVDRLVHAQLNNKEYYVLTVIAATLADVRQSYGLPRQPSFRGYAVPFHITIGVTTTQKGLV